MLSTLDEQENGFENIFMMIGKLGSVFSDRMN